MLFCFTVEDGVLGPDIEELVDDSRLSSVLVIILPSSKIFFDCFNNEEPNQIDCIYNVFLHEPAEVCTSF